MKIMLLLRLCPMVPYIILNYMLGLTRIRLSDFMIGGFGMLPGILFRIFLGSTLSSFSQENT